jgi:hypothetical protein
MGSLSTYTMRHSGAIACATSWVSESRSFGVNEMSVTDRFSGRRCNFGWDATSIALRAFVWFCVADQVRADLGWKYALGLELADPGFGHTVLSEFRSGVVAHGLRERVLDLLLAAGASSVPIPPMSSPRWGT